MLNGSSGARSLKVEGWLESLQKNKIAVQSIYDVRSGGPNVHKEHNWQRGELNPVHNDNLLRPFHASSLRGRHDLSPTSANTASGR